MAIISQSKIPELPEKKFNDPVGRNVCGWCQATMPLIKIEGGYVCPKCKHKGKPSTGSSFIKFRYKND